jgi:hypothetical protein
MLKKALRKAIGFNKKVIHKLETTVLAESKVDYSLVNKNVDLVDKYKDKSCFIIGCGPSIKNQDLSVLANQFVIGLSTFFYHNDYNKINPFANVYTGYSFHKSFHKIDYFIKSYNEIEKNTKGQLFFEEGDCEFIKENNFFVGRDVRFYKASNDISNISKKFPSIDTSIYSGQNIAIMAIQISISLGFKKIYLLGLDHSWIFQLKNKEYTKFSSDNDVNYKESKQTDFDVKGQDKLSFWIDVYHKLWSDYKRIKSLVDTKNISIIDLTEGGCLDIFEKDRLANIIKQC